MKVAWDFTCVDTVADSYFHKSSLEAGKTADMAEKMITLCKSLIPIYFFLNLENTGNFIEQLLFGNFLH